MMTELSRTEETITAGSVADPDNLPDIGGPYMIVRPVEIKETTAGGLIMPESTHEDIKFLCNVAKVLKIGPYCYKSDELKHGDWFVSGNPKEGDYVAYSRFAGKNIRFEGVNLKIIKDTDINLKVADPRSLDTFANIERA